LASHVPEAFHYSVYFHENRTEVLTGDSVFDGGDWVIVFADRGFDLGQIIGQCEPPPGRERRTLKAIVRRATPREVDTIPGKEQREAAALRLCQGKVREFRLAMEITGAEIQFDGMKVTFYYHATKYVDFRDLVRSLFKTFGTRIWMVWCDHHGPVRDVITRRGRDLMSRPLDP
jgi:cell fate regulator YaaT (PSP1 superfamily)